MLPQSTRAVFISYAHADNESRNPKERWLDRFIEFLKPLVRQEDFTLCSDQDIKIGLDWHKQIQAHLSGAKVVVLFISPAFLASDYIANSELTVILKNAADHGVLIFPILISPSLYKRSKYRYPDPKTGPQEFTLSSIQAASPPEKTLIEMTEGEQNRVLEKVADQLADLLSAPSPLGPSLEASPGAAARKVALSNLPERNPFFTGREQVLTQLQEALSDRGRAVVSGLGGIGKTQTAVEYAHRHIDEYAYILWATADSREAVVSSYVTSADLLQLPESTAKEQTLAVDAVQRWLGSHEGWLLILDNADDLGMARAFLPSGNSGHVLLTTRAQAAGAIARRVEIQEMGTEEGALFLLRRAKCIGEDAPLDAASVSDQARAKEIVAQLDGLPLALDQAAAHIEETGCGLSKYLSLYENHAPELLGRRGALTSDHPDPVAKTWALSFEKLEEANPPRLSSCGSAPFSIPMESLRKCLVKALRNSGRSWDPLDQTRLH